MKDISKQHCAVILRHVRGMSVMWVDVVRYSSGLRADVARFLVFFVDIFLTTMCAASFAFLVSASVNSFAVGQVFLVMVFILMMVCSFLPCHVPGCVEWSANCGLQSVEIRVRRPTDRLDYRLRDIKLLQWTWECEFDEGWGSESPAVWQPHSSPDCHPFLQIKGLGRSYA